MPHSKLRIWGDINNLKIPESKFPLRFCCKGGSSVICCRLNGVLPSNPYVEVMILDFTHHRVWPCLETRSLQMWSVKMRSSWSKVGPQSNMAGVLIKGEHLNTTHTQGECQVKGRTSRWGSYTPRVTKDCQQTTRSREWESPPQPSEGTNPATTLILDVQPPDLWDNTFLLLKPLSPWYLLLYQP